MKTHTPEVTDEGFQLTPMIDVVFLLIAFFMVITSEISEENINISVPVASEAIVPDEPGLRQTISVDASGTIFFGAREMDPDSLQDAIRMVMERSPETRLYVRADASAPHRHVQSVMRAAAQSGIFNIIFATNQE